MYPNLEHQASWYSQPPAGCCHSGWQLAAGAFATEQGAGDVTLRTQCPVMLHCLISIRSLFFAACREFYRQHVDPKLRS
jgi:hypothetical protein